MTMRMKTVAIRTLCLAFSVLMLGLAFEGDALAYKRSTRVTGPGGRSASQDVSASRTATGYNRSATSTGPRNRTVNTNTTGSWDASTKTWSKDKTVTGPGGQSQTIQKDTTISK
ncbi:hypothetical protein JCM15519_33890 [Fundidesulfovibrio butyratiphilus]